MLHFSLGMRRHQLTQRATDPSTGFRQSQPISQGPLVGLPLRDSVRTLLSSLRGLKLVPAKWRCLVPPRWVDWRSRVETTSVYPQGAAQTPTIGQHWQLSALSNMLQRSCATTIGALEAPHEAHSLR